MGGPPPDEEVSIDSEWREWDGEEGGEEEGGGGRGWIRGWRKGRSVRKEEACESLPDFKIMCSRQSRIVTINTFGR